MIQSDENARRLAVLFDRIGPYHHARLNAAATGGNVVAVEFSGIGDRYQWEPVGDEALYQRTQLFPRSLIRNHPLSVAGRRLRTTLGRIRPEAVAVPGWSESGALLALRWCLDTRTPAILMSDSWQASKQRRWWSEAIKRQIVPLFSAGLVAGTPQEQYLQSLGMPKKQLHQGYDTVDNAYFRDGAKRARATRAETSRRLGLPERYLLCVSRLVPEKNLFRLLTAFRSYRLSSHKNPWDLAIVGDGPLAHELAQRIRELGLNESVQLKGHQSYDMLPSYYGLAQAVVLPSISETWGLVVNEAMASSVPVLVSDRSGCAVDLVKNGYNGLTFDALSTTALQQALVHIASKDCDRAAMGRRGHAMIQKWSLETFAESLWMAVETACQHARKAHRRAGRWLVSVAARKNAFP